MAFPARPLAGEEFELGVRVTNFAARPTVRRLRVTLGGEIREREVRLAAREATEVAFLFPGLPSGRVTGEVKLLGDDDLGADDRRPLVLELPRPLRVGLITAADPAAPYTIYGGPDEGPRTVGALAALVAAIAPEGSGPGGLSLTTIPPAALDSAGGEVPDLDAYDALLVAGAEGLSGSDRAGALLLRYLRSGGGIGWLLASPSDVSALQRLARESDGGLELPGELEPDLAARAGETPRLAEADLADPLLAAFRGKASGLLARGFAAPGYVFRSRAPNGQVPLVFADGNLALARARTAAGRLVVVNLGRTDQAGAAWPLLLRALLHELVRRPEGSANGPGGASAAATAATAALNFPPGEGDLEPVDLEALARRLREEADAPRRVELAADGAQAVRGRVALAGPVILAAFLLLLVLSGGEAVRAFGSRRGGGRSGGNDGASRPGASAPPPGIPEGGRR